MSGLLSYGPPAIALVLVLALAVGMAGLWEYGKGAEQQRLLASRSALDEAERRANSLMVRLDHRLRRTQLGRSVGRRITAAGLRIRVSTFLLLLVAAAVASIYVIGVLLAPIFGVVAAVVVGWAFFRYLRRHEERRREEFISQLPELARVLSNATSAGLALRTALDMAAEELDEPARSELRHTSESLRVGQSVEQALRDLSDRLPSRELSVLVSTLIVASRAGGSLVTALRNIATTLDDRKEVRREIKTTFAQSVYTSYMVAGLGIGVLFLMNVISPGVIDRMTSSAAGLLILVVGCSLFGLGLFLVNRVSRINV
ncbi:MAG: hypothetical protein GEV03_11030 [Streptosporangiales bacterium]|nr:hypothetical protein [Streptosporangiales bacterium]